MSKKEIKKMIQYHRNMWGAYGSWLDYLEMLEYKKMLEKLDV